MSYIDKENAIKEIKRYALKTYGVNLDNSKEFAGNNKIEHYCEGLYEAVEKLEDMPEDIIPEGAVGIVRCEYCKYAFHHPLGYIYCHRDGRNAYEMVFRKDSFCSYGERKDKED